MNEIETAAVKNATGEVYVGLDLSLTGTGVSIYNANNPESSSLFEIKTKPADWDCALARVNHIATKIVMALTTRKVCFIVMEDYFMGRMQGSVIPLCELGTTVRLRLLEAGYPFLTVSPSQLKKYITGKGAGPKDIIIKHVFKRWGLDTDSNNMADAYGLSRLSHMIWNFVQGNPMTLTAYENDVAKTVVKERKFVMPFPGLRSASPPIT